MPGNFSHTPVTDGQTITAALYNGDFQNIINNMTPVGLDDYSVDVAQMQTTRDPGEVGAENLALSQADENASLRFAIKEMRRTTQWYTTAITKQELTHPIFDPASTLIRQWPDSITTNCDMLWYVPHDYHSGDVILKLWRRAGGATGTAVMRFITWRARDNTALTLIQGPNNILFTPGDLNTHIISITIAAANFQAGDMLIWRVDRLGGDASDTMAQVVVYEGSTVAYLAYAGGK